MRHKTDSRGAEMLGKLAAERGTLSRLAVAIGVSHATLSHWRSAYSRPRHEHRLAIERATNGAIPATAWMTDPERRTAGLPKARRSRTRALAAQETP